MGPETTNEPPNPRRVVVVLSLPDTLSLLTGPVPAPDGWKACEQEHMAGAHRGDGVLLGSPSINSGGHKGEVGNRQTSAWTGPLLRVSTKAAGTRGVTGHVCATPGFPCMN